MFYSCIYVCVCIYIYTQVYFSSPSFSFSEKYILKYPILIIVKLVLYFRQILLYSFLMQPCFWIKVGSFMNSFNPFLNSTNNYWEPTVFQVLGWTLRLWQLARQTQSLMSWNMQPPREGDMNTTQWLSLGMEDKWQEKYIVP